LSGPRSAPSVSYPVGRCRFRAWLLAVLGAGITLALASAAEVLTPLYRWGLGALLLAWWAWVAVLARRPVQGRLAWQRPLLDEQGHWSWSPARLRSEGSDLAPLAVDLRLDLQRCMLLRLSGPRGVPRWVWVEQGKALADWLALRRAVYAHGGVS
jgi:hypothetical protein